LVISPSVSFKGLMKSAADKETKINKPRTDFNMIVKVQ